MFLVGLTGCFTNARQGILGHGRLIVKGEKLHVTMLATTFAVWYAVLTRHDVSYGELMN
jgi:hypothetical protein